MNDHLGKPVSKHDLIRTMSAWLRQSHPEEPPLVQEALRTSVVKINLMSVDPWKDIENENILGLSVITSLKDIGGNELIAQLFELFLLDAGKIIDELSAAFEKRDIDLADQASHTLKGSAASVGAYKMHVLAKYVNDVIRTGQWPDHEGWADYVRLVYRETSTAFSAYLNTAETVTPVP